MLACDAKPSNWSFLKLKICMACSIQKMFTSFTLDIRSVEITTQSFERVITDTLKSCTKRLALPHLSLITTCGILKSTKKAGRLLEPVY